MKTVLVLLAVMLLSMSCMGVYSPIYDTTAPEITLVYTDPETVVAGYEFTLIAQVYDAESVVTVTYDLDNDGVFDTVNWGVFSESGTKTVAVRAESAGGVTLNFYYLTVESVDLFLTFTAVATVATGDFQINYTIQNFGSVPIYLTGNSYVIYDSLHDPINASDIGIIQNTLVEKTYNTYLAVNASTSEVLKGYSMEWVPYFYDITFYYNVGSGTTITEAFLGGAFSVQ